VNLDLSVPGAAHQPATVTSAMRAQLVAAQTNGDLGNAPEPKTSVVTTVTELRALMDRTEVVFVPEPEMDLLAAPVQMRSALVSMNKSDHVLELRTALHAGK